MRILDQPPNGICAACRDKATKWVGTIDELPDGRVVRQAVGVCDRHFDEFTSDAERTLGGCSDASTAANRLTGGESSAEQSGQAST